MAIVMPSSLNVTLREVKLSDGSSVYNVEIADALTLPAISAKDAQALTRKLANAIAAHTNNVVRVFYL